MIAFRQIFARPPFDSPWVHSVIARYALAAWFSVESVLGVVQVLRDPTYLLFDGRLYLEATRTWLAGGNPWDVQIAGNYFAAPPPSLLPLAPLALLPVDLGLVVLAVVVAIAAIATVRLLRLPWWWLLFPPLVQSVLAANVQALLVPLILLPGGALAATLKVYAGLPLVILGRWRSLVLFAAIVVMTIPLLPWSTYIADLSIITGRLAAQSKFTLPPLFLILVAPLVLVALVVVGRQRSAWLIVPAIWPSQQFYYGTFAMPARSKIAAALIALPVPGNGLLALGALALVSLWHDDRRDWRAYLDRWRELPDANGDGSYTPITGEYSQGTTMGLGAWRHPTDRVGP